MLCFKVMEGMLSVLQRESVLASAGGCRHRNKCSCSTFKARVPAMQAAREIAGTIANSNNRVFLNSDSLLLNLVRTLQCLAATSAWKLAS